MAGRNVQRSFPSIAPCRALVQPSHASTCSVEATGAVDWMIDALDHIGAEGMGREIRS